MIPQALVWSISAENTKSSVLQWETHISHQPCTPFWAIFRRPVVQNCIAKRLRSCFSGLGRERCPRQKRFKNVYREHRAGPWLTQCNEIMQKSVDINRLLLFNPCRRVFAARFGSPTGSSASCVCLKRWNHQFSEGRTNGSHSALLNIHRRNR